MIPNNILNSSPNNSLTFNTTVEDCSLCDNYKICKYAEEVAKIRKKLKELSERNCPDCVTFSVNCKYAHSSYDSLKITTYSNHPKDFNYSNKSYTGSPLIREDCVDRVY